MYDLAPAVYETLIPKALRLGLSANATLGLFRGYGYARRTQTFYDLYRQAKAAADNVSQFDLLKPDQAIPTRLMQPAPITSRFRYRYVVQVETSHTDTGEKRTSFTQIGSSKPLTPSEILSRATDINESALENTNVSVEKASVITTHVRTSALK